MNKKKLNNNHSRVNGLDREAHAAFERVQPRLAEMTAKEFVPIKVDIARAASRVIAAEPGIRALVSEIEEQLPAFDAGHVHSLRDVALAAWYAQVTSGPVTNEMIALINEAKPLKRALLVQADGLAHFGLLDAGKVAGIREGRGNRDLANDMLALSALFRESWDRIVGRTAVTEAQLDRAAELGTKLIEVLGAMEVLGSADGEDANDTRTRAYSLLVKTYDEVQRAVEYLRWHHGDAKEIAPSVYVKTKKARRAEVVPPADDVAPAPAPAGPDHDAPHAVEPVNPQPPPGPNGGEPAHA